MLTEVRLRNLKALAEASIPLSRLTILVGANGTGKSTVLRAIHDLSRVIDRAREGSNSPVEGVFAGSDHHTAIRTRRAVEGPVVHEAVLKDPDVTLRLDQFDARAARLPATEWLVQITRRSGTTTVGRAQALSIESRQPDLAGLSAAVRLHLSSERLAAAVPATEATPRLHPDGFGLADLLAWIASGEPERREAIERDLRAIVPAAHRYRVTRVKTTEEFEDDVVLDGTTVSRTRSRDVVANRIEVEIADAGWVPADHLSEGTLIALGLVTAL